MGTYWQPRHGHVTQMRYDPLTGGVDGRDDCFEACLARYLFEIDHPKARDLADNALIDAVRLAATGAPDRPDQPPTTLPQCEQALAAFDLRGVPWTPHFYAAEDAPWAICLVTAQTLRPARYPAGWLPAEDAPNHFILWLPAQGDRFDLFDDPLVQKTDCRYDLNSVMRAFGGAYLLPARDARSRHIAVPCALKVNPNHTCAAIAALAAGDCASLLSSAQGWSKITARGKTGYVPDEKLAA